MCVSLQQYKLLPIPLLLQVLLANQQTIVGLITFQPPFDYLLFVVLPVLATMLLCAALLQVVVCCVYRWHARKKTRLLKEV